MPLTPPRPIRRPLPKFPRPVWLAGLLLGLIGLGVWLHPFGNRLSSLQSCGAACAATPPPRQPILGQGPVNSEPPHQPPLDQGLVNSDRPLADLLSQPDFDPQQLSLLAEKSQYRLTVYYQRQPLKSYAFVLGSSPVGDKFREGDRKTPEGFFQIRDKYPHPTWSKFIWLNYPTAASWRKHQAAKDQGQISSTDTIGSEIGIHGVPAGADDWIAQGKNWTWGCLSLRNSDINELYPFLPVGTWIEIVP